MLDDAVTKRGQIGDKYVTILTIVSNSELLLCCC